MTTSNHRHSLFFIITWLQNHYQSTVSFSVASSCMDLRQPLLLCIAFLPELLPLDRSKLKFEALKSREHMVFSHNFIVLEDKQRQIKFFRSLFELTSMQLGQCQLPRQEHHSRTGVRGGVFIEKMQKQSKEIDWLCLKQ